jgi:thiol:disulfide interchange protein DsbD
VNRAGGRTSRRWLMTVLLVTTFCFAELLSQPAGSSKHVQVESKLAVTQVKRGSSFEAEVVLRIAAGWHINSHTPSQDYMIATALEIEPTEGLIVSDIRYPKATMAKLALSEDSLSVYEGTVSIIVPFTSTEKLPAGRNSAVGKITIQACNDKVCLPPSTISIALPFEVVP